VDLSPGAPLDVALYWQFSRLTAPATAPLTREIRAAAAQVLVRDERASRVGTII